MNILSRLGEMNIPPLGAEENHLKTDEERILHAKIFTKKGNRTIYVSEFYEEGSFIGYVIDSDGGQWCWSDIEEAMEWDDLCIDENFTPCTIKEITERPT